MNFLEWRQLARKSYILPVELRRFILFLPSAFDQQLHSFSSTSKAACLCTVHFAPLNSATL
jgi:hypothetical protein